MPFKCLNCGNIYKRFFKLKAHLLFKHMKEDKFHCSDCEKKVKEDSRLKFPCELCDKQFDKKCKLDEHMYFHSNEKRFHCTHCSRTFTYKKYLAKHAKTHLPGFQTKRYHCDVCGHCCGELGRLRKHVELKHLKPETPYYCSVCKQEFESIAHVTRHMIPDTEGKPFSCAECDLRFIRLGHLQYHLASHRAEKPFLCNRCGKTFKLNTQLTIHMATHSPSRSKKAYKCECGKAYIKKASLKRHWIISHQNPKPRKKRTVKRVGDKNV